MQLAADVWEDLIHVPDIARLRPAPTELGSNPGAELEAPLLDALVGDEVLLSKDQSTSRKVRLACALP
jgi:hypothetical protein